MAAATKGQTPHTSSNKLEDQAANAALYVTRGYSSSTNSRSVLDEDGKLSSASAATSLKYARPQDLPSFPSPGLKLSSAGAAASLAESNKKSFEHWKPDAIPAANKAALLAQNYEMDPLWQPEMSAAGSKAAMLAQRDGGNVNIWQPTASEAGSSAAGQAMGMKQPDAITGREVDADGRSKALLAATGALASGRRRAESAPIKPEPDNSWALGAATKSHRGAKQNQAYFGKGDPGFDAARIQNMAKGNVSRSMYGSNPPVALEVEERNRQATLRASAIAMAQKMYAIQQTHLDEAKGRTSESRRAAREMHRRGLSDSISDLGEEPEPVPNKYVGLEEAARKLAMERLARLHDENAEYRDYYGQPTTPTRSRLSLRGRRRSSSDGQADLDEEQSKRIRSQMSIFQSKLAAVDNKKRQGDRDAVLAAAQKNVAERMATLDEKVFQETGKSSPHQTEMWEKAAREKAQADSDTRMVNHGKVHIGGGKYLDQSDVDAIARARLQPTLDEISDTAEKRRARDEELRLEEEKRKRDAETERLRAAEAKAEMKKTRDAEKAEEQARLAAIKQEEQAKRAAEKQEQDAKKAAEKQELDAKRATEKQELDAKKTIERQEQQTRKQEEQARRAEEKRIRKEELDAGKERERVAKEENRKSKEGKGSRFAGLLGTVGIGGGAAAGIGAATTAAAPTAEAATTTGETAVVSGDAEPPVEDAVHEPAEETEVAKPMDVHFLTTVPQPEEASTYSEPAQAIDMPVPAEETTQVEDTAKPATEAMERAEPTGTTAPTGEPIAVVPYEETTPLETTHQATPTPKGDSKMKTWLKSRFRTSSKAQKDMEEDGKKPGFIGGAALTGAGAGAGEAGGSPDLGKSDSVKEVAMAGRSTTHDTDDLYEASEKAVSPVHHADDTAAGRSPSISSMSDSDEEGKHAPRGRRGFKERFLGKSTTQESGEEKNDDFEEARDTFDEEKLTPPPKLSTLAEAGTKSSNSPSSRERSKFKEDL